MCSGGTGALTQWLSAASQRNLHTLNYSIYMCTTTPLLCYSETLPPDSPEAKAAMIHAFSALQHISVQYLYDSEEPTRQLRSSSSSSTSSSSSSSGTAATADADAEVGEYVKLTPSSSTDAVVAEAIAAAAARGEDLMLKLVVEGKVQEVTFPAAAQVLLMPVFTSHANCLEQQQSLRTVCEGLQADQSDLRQAMLLAIEQLNDAISGSDSDSDSDDDVDPELPETLQSLADLYREEGVLEAAQSAAASLQQQDDDDSSGKTPALEQVVKVWRRAR
jgi:hypothetical protein